MKRPVLLAPQPSQLTTDQRTNRVYLLLRVLLLLLLLSSLFLLVLLAANILTLVFRGSRVRSQLS
jgi:hypothetical protein